MLHFLFFFLAVCVGCAKFHVTPKTVGRPWPLPQLERPAPGHFVIHPNAFEFESSRFDCDILQNAYSRYMKIIFAQSDKDEDWLSNEVPIYDNVLTKLSVMLLRKCEELPYLHMDEQYQLKICAPDTPGQATLISQSVWGVLRGLETFSHLIVRSKSNHYLINCTQILDYPRFAHRGLMLDTSRHYLPTDTIKANLDLMAMNKFNVFHWHIVDSPSFPYVSKVYPDLSKKGAWSDIHIYRTSDVADIVDYARQRGIRVMVEFDTPGHTHSWGYGVPGLLTACYNVSTGLPDGTYGPIDPSKEKNYEFLKTFFTEIGDRFPERYLHLGGDEVPFDCWKSNPEITEFMTSLNISEDYKKLEEYYINRLVDIVSKLPSKNGYMVWQEVFDNGVQINDETVVHVWKNIGNTELALEEVQKVTAAGYRALLSSCWYLNYISYGIDWHKYYECDPQDFVGSVDQHRLVIGGEACMWGEFVDKTNVIPRTWPRASTVAERLWSDAVATNSSDAAASRLEEHRCRLLGRGFPVEPFGPSFCEGIL